MFRKAFDSITWNFPVFDFLIDISIVTIIGVALTAFFNYYVKEEPGKRKFARNLLPVMLGMMFFASIISASAAMALAGVGALSIVRYRAIVHSVESLIFVFMALAIGLAAGTGQILTGVLAALVIMAFLSIQKWIVERKGGTMRLTATIPKDSASALMARFSTDVPKFRMREMSYSPTEEEWMVDLPLNTEEEILELKGMIRDVDPKITYSLEDANG